MCLSVYEKVFLVFFSVLVGVRVSVCTYGEGILLLL